MTTYYTSKFFNHVDNATTFFLPRKAFLRWVKDSTNKLGADTMLIYAIMAMGTVFTQRPECKRHQDIFIDIVNNAVLRSGDIFSLQLVQTKLILALLAFSQGQHNRAWDLCGSAMRISLNLRYHTEAGVAAIEGTQDLAFGLDHATLIECRRRTFWSVFVMDCFNGCCSSFVVTFDRSDCHLRLPCSQGAFEKGPIPVTCFGLDLSSTYHDTQSGHRLGLAEVGLLGYVVEIATILNEVLSRISKSTPQATEAERQSREAFRQDTMRRLDAWDNLTKHRLQQGRDGRESVNGLHILYHYTAIILHRYIWYPETGKDTISVYVRGAHEHARLMLEMVQRLSNHDEKDTQLFRFATLSPFSGFAITAALDVITAAGTMTDLMGHRSQMMSLISSGVEALETLVDFWDSARRQRDMIRGRLATLLESKNRASDFNGAFYFGQPMQSPYGLDQDIVYGLPRPRYFEALGWNDRIHHEGDFHRLD